MASPAGMEVWGPAGEEAFVKMQDKAESAEAQIAKTSGQMGVGRANGLLGKMKELDEEVTIAWKRGFKSHSAFVTFETELAYYAVGAEYRKYGYWSRAFQADYLDRLPSALQAVSKPGEGTRSSRLLPQTKYC